MFHTEVAQNYPQCQILPKSGLDSLKMANFGHFAGFSVFYPKMRLRLTQNGQFHLIYNFSHLLPPKCLIFGGGGRDTSAIFLSFSTFSNHFTPKQLKITHNGEFCPEKWLRLAQNGQFWSFCMFFHLFSQNEAQIDLEWPISPNSQLSPFFATKVSHFWRNLKNFCSWGRGFISQFSYIGNFLNCFQPMWLKMNHNGQFCHQSGSDWLEMGNFG